jgi:translocator protein
MTKINWPRLIASILIAQLAGGLGAIATTPNIPTWYATLNKPFFNPPSWLFGPVWTLLFLLMGIAFYLIWTKKKSPWHPSLRWYWIQLVLNTLWSFLFFGAQNPGLALVEIFFLWFAIYQTIKSFSPINRTASLLLYPYLAWVSFATLLNAAIFYLNH